MKKMFGSMMQGFFSGMSEEDKQNWISRLKKMTEMCPCMSGKEMPEEDKKKMMEKMMSCCDGMMEMMSTCFKNPTQTGSSKKG